MGKLCVNYASSSSLGHLRFLVFLLLGYAGFLRVDELHSLKVGDISLLMTIWQSPSGSEETTSIEKAIQFTSPSRVHLTGSSSETPLIRKIVKSKKSECFHPTKEISTTTTNREEFNTHVLPFAVNIQQLSICICTAWSLVQHGTRAAVHYTLTWLTGTPLGAAHLPKGVTSNIEKMIFSKCPSRWAYKEHYE